MRIRAGHRMVIKLTVFTLVEKDGKETTVCIWFESFSFICQCCGNFKAWKISNEYMKMILIDLFIYQIEFPIQSFLNLLRQNYL